MIRRVLPKTLIGQLITMLAIVLGIAQIINLALLVGMQRIQERSNAYQNAIELTARMAARLPETFPDDFPYELRRERGAPDGAFFLSRVNRASLRDDAKQLPRYNARFFKQLEEAGLTPLQTSVTFLPYGPEKLRLKQDRFRPDREGFRSGPSSDRPPPRENLFHPDRPPSYQRGPNPRSLQLGQKGPQRLQEIRLSAEIQEGVWLNAMIPHAAIEPLTNRIVLSTALLLILSLFAAWVFARRISYPLSEFTRAADQLGRGGSPQLLAENGPLDLQKAAKAFNTMQMRLTRMLETQRYMLRAVGHDLRTPLTSLRIRAEMIPEDVGREKFISTLNDMTIMTEEILGWAKDVSGLEDTGLVDLEAFLSSLVDDYQDEGYDIVLKSFPSRAISIRRTAIKRALQNLINNALQYGNNAVVSVETTKSHLWIHVDDTGPGIPEDKLEDVCQPFVRLEASRNKETGGTGLGLSIVETIVQTHGGRLILVNRKPNGLRATLGLPI